MKKPRKNSESNAPNDWLIDGGDMGEFIRSMSWSETPLGPRADWPYPLQATTNLALSSTFPMAILWGKELIFVYNDAYRTIAADRHPKAMGKSTREIWPEVWDFNKPIFEKVMQEGQMVHLEDQLFRIKRGGAMVGAYFTLSYCPIWLDHDRVGGTLVILIETTDRKQSEESMKQAKQTLEKQVAERTADLEHQKALLQQLALDLSSAEDRERKRIAAVLHDDFQQTLAYIKLKLANVHRGSGLHSNLKSIFPIIDGCIQNCRDLANELSPRIIEEKGFFGALKWLCWQMKEMYGLDVDLQSTDEPEINPIELASTLIRCIRELLFNVVKHSGQMEASVNVERDGKIVTIIVEDDGKGCDYDRFGHKQLKGSSFGLFNIEDRIKLFGGHMQVQSQLGKGFQATLKVPSANIKGLEKESIRILLADDHEVMREGLSSLIKGEADMEIVGMGANGKEAVALALEVKPDVIIMDISMPVMNGIDATKQIKEILPDTFIVGLSMHADPEIQQAMLDAGSCACLTKEDSVDKIVETLRSLPLNKSHEVDTLI